MSSKEDEDDIKLQNNQEHQGCKDLWQDDLVDCDNLLSQAYDQYISQPESIVQKNVTSSSNLPSSVTKKDAVYLSPVKKKKIEPCVTSKGNVIETEVNHVKYFEPSKRVCSGEVKEKEIIDCVQNKENMLETQANKHKPFKQSDSNAVYLSPVKKKKIQPCVTSEGNVIETEINHVKYFEPSKPVCSGEVKEKEIIDCVQNKGNVLETQANKHKPSEQSDSKEVCSGAVKEKEIIECVQNKGNVVETQTNEHKPFEQSDSNEVCSVAVKEKEIIDCVQNKGNVLETQANEHKLSEQSDSNEVCSGADADKEKEIIKCVQNKGNVLETQANEHKPSEQSDSNEVCSGAVKKKKTQAKKSKPMQADTNEASANLNEGIQTRQRKRLACSTKIIRKTRRATYKIDSAATNFIKSSRSRKLSTNTDTPMNTEEPPRTRSRGVIQGTSKISDPIIDLNIVSSSITVQSSQDLSNTDNQNQKASPKITMHCDKQGTNSSDSVNDLASTSSCIAITVQSRQNELGNSPTKQASAESEEESLFGGDFSDNDPTYIPFDIAVNSPQSDSDSDSDLFDPSETDNNRKKGIHMVFGKTSQVADPNNNEPLYIAQSLMDDVFKTCWKTIKPRSRWVTEDRASWKTNVNKRRRNEGLSYVTGNKIRTPKIPKLVDCSKCKFECNAHVSNNMRNEICRKYWALNFVARKAFILAHIDIKHPKRVLLQRTRSTQRSYSKQCFFIIENEKINVCQDFFCRTLSISPGVIANAIKQRNSFGQYAKDQEPRGRREPPNKTSPEAVNDVKRHIASFPSMESHYVRKKTKRQYLQAGLTLSKMYSLYVDECKEKNMAPAVSEMTYRRIFCTEFNLGFFVPKKDQCLLCNKFNQASGESRTNLKKDYDDHIKRKQDCNKEKENDKKRAEQESNFMSVTFDLQAILQIPASGVGLLYYSRKLTVYNLTVYENKLPNEAYCFLWNEMNGKKGSSEIGTILLHYLTNCLPKEITEISLFSDTCGGQNRNQYIAALLLWLMMQNTQLEVVEHKFLESGHSYMEVDSMHSAIETAKKNCEVFCMSDWINIFKRARSKTVYKIDDKKVTKNCYRVKQFKYDEFKDLKDLADNVIVNRSKNTYGERVNWLKIKRMKYLKDDKIIYYNYDMSDSFMAMDVTNSLLKENDPASSATAASHLQHGYATRNNRRHQQNRDDEASPPPPSTSANEEFSSLKQLYDGPLPISMAKKKDLINLCRKGVIPDEYHGWFESLPTESNQVDRLPAATLSDTDDEYSDGPH